VSSLVGMIDASTSPDRMRYYVSFSIIIFLLCRCHRVFSLVTAAIIVSSFLFFLSVLFCYFFLATEYMCAGNE
jgi:hypothetical protein